MILEFKTKPDINGNIQYIAIDINVGKYSTFYRAMVPNGFIVSRKDYKAMLKKCVDNLDFCDWPIT